MTIRVLVTGATGFVGRRLCRELVTNNISVRALVREPSHPNVPSDVELQFGDITDARAARAASKDIDVIIHLAARVHLIRDTAPDPLLEFRRANVEGTRILATAGRDAGVQHIVFASSVKAVGDASTVPWTSATPPNPTDAYGISKLEAEQFLLAERSGEQPTVTVLRFPLVYGPEMKGNMLRLFRIIDQGWPIPVGSAENSRSVLFVGNATAAIKRVVERVTSQRSIGTPGPFFVADGPGVSTAILVKDVAAALRAPSRTVRMPPELLRVLTRIGDPVTRGRISPALNRLLGSLEVDEKEFERAYSYRPPYTREQGLEITARWFLQA